MRPRKMSPQSGHILTAMHHMLTSAPHPSTPVIVQCCLDKHCISFQYLIWFVPGVRSASCAHKEKHPCTHCRLAAGHGIMLPARISQHLLLCSAERRNLSGPGQACLSCESHGRHHCHLLQSRLCSLPSMILIRDGCNIYSHPLMLHLMQCRRPGVVTPGCFNLDFSSSCASAAL